MCCGRCSGVSGSILGEGAFKQFQIKTLRSQTNEKSASSTASGGVVVKFGALMQEVAGSIPVEGTCCSQF